MWEHWPKNKSAKTSVPKNKMIAERSWLSPLCDWHFHSRRVFLRMLNLCVDYHKFGSRQFACDTCAFYTSPRYALEKQANCFKSTARSKGQAAEVQAAVLCVTIKCPVYISHRQPTLQRAKKETISLLYCQYCPLNTPRGALGLQPLLWNAPKRVQQQTVW